MSTIFLPFWEAHKANQEIESKKVRVESRLPSIPGSYKIETEILRRVYLDTLETKTVLEGKAKESIVAASIVASVITVSSGFLENSALSRGNVLMQYTAFLLLVIAGFYLGAGAILAVKVLKTDNQVYIIPIEYYARGDSWLRTAYDVFAQKNDLQNIIRNNHMSASYTCIAVGLVVSIALMVILASPVATPPSP